MLFVTYVTLLAERSKEAVEDLKKLKPPPGVVIRSIYVLFGKYDALLVYETHDEKMALDLIFQLRKIGGVYDTETYVAADLERIEVESRHR